MVSDQAYEEPSISEPTDTDSSKKPSGAPKKRTQTRSDIAFPYVHLEEAVGIARVIFEAGAVPLSRDQIAAILNVSPGSGNFGLKLAAARMFGLTEIADGRHVLTDLGSRAVSNDDNAVRSAKRDAFLNVPLYNRVASEFRGKQLPPRPSGLEQAFVNFGVAPLQKDKARHAFDKSATYAGFFPNGKDRLVEPIIGPVSAARQTTEVHRDTTENTSSRSKSNEISAVEDPLIHGLLIRLPPPGAIWEQERRVRWLQTLANNFDMVYKTNEEDNKELCFISVRLDKI
jgi:hypothetical protein